MISSCVVVVRDKTVICFEGVTTLSAQMAIKQPAEHTLPGISQSWV